MKIDYSKGKTLE